MNEKAKSPPGDDEAAGEAPEAPEAPAESAQADEAPVLGGDGGVYTVLARKYRPRTFAELIGQEAMVRTLDNAFRSGRIAQAYMLTGVRGVGKTTTARILARALNYKTAEVDRPSLDMPELGEHCAAIMESRHPDVLEIDAASNTGVDNVREIVDAARYRPAYARHKVYIVDEVHMLSRQAFNALLKTLEEPPEHVKFVFATTEVRKVPVTVLSRCQRYDLRRVDLETLQAHFKAIAEKENVEVADRALTLIARAAEGSVRDGLSLLDQAIAHAQGPVAADNVRAMLGLAERTRVFDLLETVLKGEAGPALEALAALHDEGAEPLQILADMAEAVHVATRIKVAGAQAADSSLSETERARAEALATGLSMPALARAWQMLLKGLAETREAPRPLAAADMVLVRLAYAADLPTPDAIVKGLSEESGPSAGAAGASPQNGSAPGEPVPAAAPMVSQVPPLEGVPPPPPPAPVPERAPTLEPEAPMQLLPQPAAEEVPSPPPPPLPQSFDEVVTLLESAGEAKLRHALEHRVRLVRFSPGHIELALLNGAGRGLPNELGARLERLTGARWLVAVSDEAGEAPIAERRRRQAAEERERVTEHRAVQALLARFPGATIKQVRAIESLNGAGGGAMHTPGEGNERNEE